ncbi:MAG: polysaccharide biosynthesis tyrosine autokinase, partial [Pseudomonadota bacterium]
PDPDRAAKIANAFARSFINAQVDKRFQANAYAKTFLDDRIKQLDIKLKASQKTMLDFADREKIVQTQKKTSIAEENLAAANVAFGQLVSERIRAEEAWKQVAKSDGINLPQLLSNKVIDGLRARRNELTTTYKEKRETFQPSYPSMVQQQNKIDEVERQLAREVQAVKQSLKATFDAAVSQEEAMLKRIGTLRSDVLDLQKRSVRYDFLRQEVDTNQSLYDGLMKRYKEIDLAGGVAANNVFVIDQAERSSVPSSPNLPRALTLSIVLGTVLGIGLALLLEGLDDRFAHPSEVEERTGLPRLGLIPFMDPDAKTFGAAAARHTAVLEAYRSVSTALQFSTDTGLPKTLAISSAGPSEGKSTTALAIASHFAALGQKVLLVDADLRKPSLHDKLRCQNRIGLSNYLIGTHAPPELLQQSQQPMLAFLASGPLPPNPSELLAGPHFEALINNASNVFDLIVVDTPPVLGFADTQLLTTCTDATLMCVAAQQTRKGLFMNALQSLHFSRAPLVGFVFTKYNASPLDEGYDYAYGGSHRAHENTATWPPPTSHHLTDRADQSPTFTPQTGQHG